MQTEKQKARAGKLYDANYDTELIAECAACKELCYDYNRLRPAQTDKKKRILSELLGKTGENFQIEPPFYCDYGYNIEIGENFYANVNCVILDGAKVTFGNNVFIAPNCGFYTAPDIRWMWRSETKGWNTLTLSPSATTCGLGRKRAFCPA